MCKKGPGEVFFFPTLDGLCFLLLSRSDEFVEFGLAVVEKRLNQLDRRISDNPPARAGTGDPPAAPSTPLNVRVHQDEAGGI